MAEITQNKIDRPDWLPQDVWPFQIRTTRVDGNTIAYTDEGTGPVLVLVHDGMWSYVWGQLIAELQPEFRVVTLDFPGSGLSGQSDGPASLEADSRVLEAFVAHLELADVTLVLHDLGGCVGLGMAGRRPDVVSGLVLVNTFAWPADKTSLRVMFGVMGNRAVKSLNVATNLVPRMTSTRFGVGRNLDSSGRSAFLGGFERRTARARFHDLMAAARTETDYLAWVETQLATTLSDKPVLTVFGAKNDPFGFQERFRDYFHDIQDIVIPGANHFPMTDDPTGLAARISEWHAKR